MKLARPDVFHPRIVFASCASLPEGDDDDIGLVEALRARGLPISWRPWDDPATLEADLVVLRATWDYTERLDEFLVWTRAVRNLLNPPDMVAWSADKHYLLDLAQDGLPIVPTQYYAPGDRVRAPRGEVVVKPAIGAGSVGAQRFVDPRAAVAHAALLQSDDRAVLVQPYDPRISAGETALVFLNGEASHAFTKGPILPPAGRRPELEETGTFATEKLGAADPADEVWEIGHAAVAAA
ncbi:MAG: hypothetical protein WBV64_11195, partial [Mycobacterium sp.]